MMIYRKVPPPDFQPAFEVVGTILDYHGEILLLRRNRGKPEPETWGLPAGTCRPGASLLSEAQREVAEETGLRLSSSQLSFLETVYVRAPERDFTFHLFQAVLVHRPGVTLNKSGHHAYCWSTPDEWATLALITDLGPCLELYLNRAPTGSAHLPKAVLVFPMRPGRILLGVKKRKVAKGLLIGPGGMVNPSESLVQAAVRETLEETGMRPWNLREMGTVAIHYPDRPDLERDQVITVFFSESWLGRPRSTEELGQLTWYSTSRMPYDRMMPDDKPWLSRMLQGERVTVSVIMEGGGKKVKEIVFE